MKIFSLIALVRRRVLASWCVREVASRSVQTTASEAQLGQITRLSDSLHFRLQSRRRNPQSIEGFADASLLVSSYSTFPRRKYCKYAMIMRWHEGPTKLRLLCCDRGEVAEWLKGGSLLNSTIPSGCNVFNSLQSVDAPLVGHTWACAAHIMQ
jgi:hypothetical protein